MRHFSIAKPNSRIIQLKKPDRDYSQYRYIPVETASQFFPSIAAESSVSWQKNSYFMNVMDVSLYEYVMNVSLHLQFYIEFDAIKTL